MRRDLPKPDYPIGPILEHYGVNIPSRRGGWVKVRCPIHEDRSPSAGVNFDANRFVCYAGCTDPRGEDAVGLIQLVENLAFPAALKEAEGLSGGSHRIVRTQSRRGSSLLDEPWD